MLYSVYIYVGCRCTCSLTTIMCQHCSCLVHFHYSNMLTISPVWSVWSTPSHSPIRLGGGRRSCFCNLTYQYDRHPLTVSQSQPPTPTPEWWGGRRWFCRLSKSSPSCTFRSTMLCDHENIFLFIEKIVVVKWFVQLKKIMYTVNELIFLSKPNRIICPLSLYFLVKVLICRCRLFLSSQEESLTIPLRNKKRFDLWSER